MIFDWTTRQVKTSEEVQALANLLELKKPDYIFMDTETTGLHIIYDKPFVVQFGFVYGTKGLAIAVDLEQDLNVSRAAIDVFLRYATTCQFLVGHNLSFDLHMQKNIGFNYTQDNVTDTTFYIRHAHDTISQKNGGPPLKLKEYAARYIDPAAKAHESTLKREQTAIAAQHNRELMAKLGMRKKDFDEFFKDPVHDLEDFPLEKTRKFQEWKENLPGWLKNRFEIKLESSDIPYTVLNREELIKYALYDIVYTAEIFMALKDIVKTRHNEQAIEYENKLIQPLIDMERTGFAIDFDYLSQARTDMKKYIIRQRSKLHALAKQPIKTGQHQKIRKILNEDYHIMCSSTNAQQLTRTKEALIQTNEHSEALDFISVLQELRTLEKWYSTYILRFVRELKNRNRLYTTIHQVGTVSGRVTSDFQQFPKYGIRTADNKELFHPRKMVKVPGGDYNALVYIDYSQIELRLQAMYTILVGHPDKNLCRAYMPYECVDVEGKLFDPEDPEDVARWREDWYQKEDGKLWEPLDVHGATTEQAFGITPDHPDFKKYRGVGKTVNFCKNYGGQRGQIRSLFPHFSDAQIDRIDAAYYKAFPGVKTYHDYCYRISMAKPQVSNLLGVRYTNVNGHNLINMLIQGSGAYVLKWKIRQLWEYTKAKGYKSRMQMNIHDEISWEYHKDDPPSIFLEFQRIMQDWPDSLVPLTADIEISTTTWAGKEEIEDAKEIYTCLSNAGRIRLPKESSRIP